MLLLLVGLGFEFVRVLYVSLQYDNLLNMHIEFIYCSIFCFIYGNGDVYFSFVVSQAFECLF